MKCSVHPKNYITVNELMLVLFLKLMPTQGSQGEYKDPDVPQAHKVDRGKGALRDLGANEILLTSVCFHFPHNLKCECLL